MDIKPVTSLTELKLLTKASKKAFLLLFRLGSEQSDCALQNLEESRELAEGLLILSADVNQVRDIHPEYGIQTVPTLLEFDSGELRNVIKGCQQKPVLKAFFEEAAFRAQLEKEGKTARRVTVYSTPTCSWCTTLKNYLRKNKIPFSDVDISRDPEAARQLVGRSGHQGVPQTEIDGNWVIGFDQAKLNTLLEIR
ncbi:MAG: thioredoxin family protein [Bacteroidales bacterium]